MQRYLGRYSEQLYAVLRIVAGFLFLQHGSQKLFGFPGDVERAELMSRFGIAGLIEFFGGILIALGLFAGWVAFIASGEMAAAYFIAHAPRGFWPIVNAGTLAALYCFVFLYIASRGAGIWSVDQALGRTYRTRRS